MKLNAYTIVNERVEQGVAYGYHRAFKYTDKPDDNQIIDAISDAVMNALSEVIVWDESDEADTL